MVGVRLGQDMIESCETCRFVLVRKITYPEVSTSHACRRYPPTPHSIFIAYWPEVSQHAWCGEYTPLDSRNPKP